MKTALIYIVRDRIYTDLPAGVGATLFSATIDYIDSCIPTHDRVIDVEVIEVDSEVHIYSRLPGEQVLFHHYTLDYEVREVVLPE